MSIPAELMQNRAIIEGNFIGALWKNTDNYYEYKIDPINDLKTDDGQFFYSLGYNIIQKGHKVLDELTILSFLKDFPELLEKYESKGGYRQIRELIKVIEEKNVEAYYDELCKNNLLIQLHKYGFNILPNLEKFNKLTTVEIRDYYEYLFEKLIIKNVNSGIKIEDLIIDDSFIEQCNNGVDNGIPYGKICHILNYITLGIPLGNIFLFAGFSGTGKTSFMLACMVLPAIEEGYKACIISNEQVSSDFKRLLLAMTLYDECNYYKVTRKKLKTGQFTSENKEYIEKAKQIINKKYGDKLKFVKLYDYNISKVKSIVKKLAKEGYQLFIYDTMKGENLTEGQVWQQLVEDSKQLFQVASKENVAIVPTYQLALHSLNKRFLDETCLSNAKQIKEVCSEIILMRPLWDDEYTGESHDVKAYRNKRDNGKITNVKEMIKLEKDKKYYILFVNKTRNDEGKQQLIYEWNSLWNRWNEIGFCTVRNDHI